MATVSLQHIEKIYPAAEGGKKKKKKEPEKKNNLKVTEQGVVAVDDFNLEIADQEFIVLVGPSGCGKSTTLRMVAGLEEITNGDLYIDGKRMNGVESKDRDISMVFQNYALYPHLTVRQNLEFPLKLRKMPKAEMDKRVEHAAESPAHGRALIQPGRQAAQPDEGGDHKAAPADKDDIYLCHA